MTSNTGAQGGTRLGWLLMFSVVAEGATGGGISEGAGGDELAAH